MTNREIFIPMHVTDQVLISIVKKEFLQIYKKKTHLFRKVDKGCVLTVFRNGNTNGSETDVQTPSKEKTCTLKIYCDCQKFKSYS